MTIYRIMTTEAGLADSAMAPVGAPVGCSGLMTGFWTPCVESIKAIIEMADDNMFQYDGGSCWGNWFVILETTMDNVVTCNAAEMPHSGHDGRSDRDELFVTAIIDETAIKITRFRQWEKENR